MTVLSKRFGEVTSRHEKRSVEFVDEEGRAADSPFPGSDGEGVQPPGRRADWVGSVGAVINKSMDRADLLTADAAPIVSEINQLVRDMYSRGAPMTSWYGTLPRYPITPSFRGMRNLIKRCLHHRISPELDDAENRGGPDYRPLPGAADDARLPWFLYWEIFWVIRHGPRLERSAKLLDAGGAASLFSSYLASLGHQVYSIDLNPQLVAHGNAISSRMGWEMRSLAMNMAELDFEDEAFDHAYAICVFEHLDHGLRQRALREIARCLRPGGVLSITFDYRGHGVSLANGGLNYDPENLLRDPSDIERNFLSTGLFEPVGNPDFCDNGKSYLTWPGSSHRYSFGAQFLRKAG